MFNEINEFQLQLQKFLDDATRQPQKYTSLLYMYMYMYNLECLSVSQSVSRVPLPSYTSVLVTREIMWGEGREPVGEQFRDGN